MKTLLPLNEFQACFVPITPPPPTLQDSLEALKASAKEVLLMVGREPGRKDHRSANHADLCGIEMAVVELGHALRNRAV
jgi:hypothetical protein